MGFPSSGATAENRTNARPKCCNSSVFLEPEGSFNMGNYTLTSRASYPASYVLSKYLFLLSDICILFFLCLSDHPVRTYGLVDQGDFLMQMGIYQRLQDAMSSASNEEKAKQIFTSFQSITSPQHMGSKFKVLAVQSQSLPEPLGFMIQNDDE